MADEPTLPGVVQPAAPAPNAPAPVIAPVEPAAPQPAPSAEPAAPAAPEAPEIVPEPAKPEEKPAEALKPHTETKSLLEEAGKKPEEPKPTEPPKPGEDAPPEKVARVYELKLPEDVKVAPEEMQKFEGLLREHDLSPEIGQELLDRHTAQLKNYATFLAQEQHRVFGETRAGWRTQIMSDPEMGGSGMDTTTRAVASMRDMFVRPEHMQEFNDFCNLTGAGDHPALWRMLYNISRRFSEPASPQAPFKPPADIGRAPKQGRRGTLYDHPTSGRVRG